MISFEKALKLIKKNIAPLNMKRKELTIKAVGQCLAEDIFSKINIPPQNNSAVDGRINNCNSRLEFYMDSNTSNQFLSEMNLIVDYIITELNFIPFKIED